MSGLPVRWCTMVLLSFAWSGGVAETRLAIPTFVSFRRLVAKRKTMPPQVVVSEAWRATPPSSSSLSASSAPQQQQQEEDTDVEEFWRRVRSDKALPFSIIMTTCGAVLGPFLDSYHSALGVLQYDSPITWQLWGSSPSSPALITTWWVPPLFGVAGFLIGWLYVLLDVALSSSDQARSPTPPKTWMGISLFTLQYWLSGILYGHGMNRSSILGVLSGMALVGFVGLDGTLAGFWTSLATAVGGPAIEVGLLTTLAGTSGGYHYTDAGETGFFPLWILPVYFLGGPAVGNLARLVWSRLPLETKERDTGL